MVSLPTALCRLEGNELDFQWHVIRMALPNIEIIAKIK